MACRWHTTRMGGFSFSLYDLPKSVIAFAWDVNMYNLKRNLHVFTWLLHNLANLLVNISLHKKTSGCHSSKLIVLFVCIQCSFFLSYFFSLRRSNYDLFRNIRDGASMTACSWHAANNKMHENGRQLPERRTEKTQWSGKEVILLNDVFIFIHLNFRVCFPAQTHHITCDCQPFIHSSIFNFMVVCRAVWRSQNEK